MSTTPTLPSTPPPLPEPDQVTQGFWEACNRNELAIQRCLDCGLYMHFPGPVCRACASDRLVFSPVSGRGEVYSYVVVHQTTIPAYKEQVPYVVAWVELPEQAGLRILSVIRGVDPKEVHVGQHVEVVFEPVDAEVKLPMFRPAGPPQPRTA